MPKSASTAIRTVLEPADVRNDVTLAGAPLLERDDRVADELTGTVIGDVAAAIGFDELGADRRGIAQHVRAIGARTERVDVRMFLQEQVLLVRVLVHRALQRLAFTVRNEPEPAGVEKVHASSESQSRGLEHRPHLVQERRRVCTVEGAVVPRQCEMADVVDGDRVLAVGTLDHDGLLADAVGGEDRDLRLVDDRQRQLGAERTHVRDGEGAADDFVRAELLALRAAPRGRGSRAR